MRVLIVKLSPLEGVVHAMPAIQDLLAAHPEAKIDWVVDRAWAPLAERCKGVHRVVASDLRHWPRGALAAPMRREWGRLRAALLAHAYDAVVDLQDSASSALLSWLAPMVPGGLRHVAGRGGCAVLTPARWVADRSLVPVPRSHRVEQARALCAQALGYGVEGPARFELGSAGQAVAMPVPPHPAHLIHPHANPFLPRKPVVALAHGAAHSDQQWPLSHWVQLGQRLNHHGFAVALPHSNEAERALSVAIAGQLADAWVWPALALDATIDTLAGCAGVVGVEGDLSHIALALDVPHVRIHNLDTVGRSGVQTARQVSVFAAPQPGIEAVWQAWVGLDTPVFSR